MAETKTKPTAVSVSDFLAAAEPERRRQEGRDLCAMMQEITGEPPVLWGPSIVGFGKCHYKYASGHEGDMGWIGFSPRKGALTIYIVPGFNERPDLVEALGPKAKTSVSCLYLKRLDDVDAGALRALCAWAVETTKARYPAMD